MTAMMVTQSQYSAGPRYLLATRTKRGGKMKDMGMKPIEPTMPITSAYRTAPSERLTQCSSWMK